MKNLKILNVRQFVTDKYDICEFISYLILNKLFKDTFYLHTKFSEIDGRIIKETGEHILIENKIRTKNSVLTDNTSICEEKKIIKIINDEKLQNFNKYLFTFYKDGILIDYINDVKTKECIHTEVLSTELVNHATNIFTQRTNLIFKSSKQQRKLLDLSKYIDMVHEPISFFHKNFKDVQIKIYLF